MSDTEKSNDHLSPPASPVKPPPVDEGRPPAPTKPKRVMTEKQLENLARAREKANKVLKEKRARRSEMKAQEKKLKELQLKQREDAIQSQLNSLTKSVDVHGRPEPEEVRYVRKSVKKKKEPKIVYYSSSSSDESEPEIVYKKKPRSKRKVYRKEVHHHTQPPPQPSAPPPAPPAPVHNPDEQAMKEQYERKVEQMRRRYLVDTMFPSG